VAGASFERFHEKTCPTDGRLAFVTTKDGNSEVYVMNPDGSGLGNISNNVMNDLDPTWAPDCMWIAYSSDRDGFESGTFETFVAAVDGSSTYRLTLVPEGAGGDQQPKWSPDGGHIAFNRGHDVYVIKPDGSGLTWVAFGTSVTWSPDGQKLSYRHPIGDFPTDQYEVNVDGTERRLIAAGEPPPRDCFQDVLSPDGTKRACMTTRDASNQEVYVIDVASGRELNITNNLSSTDTAPAWSPDSRQIAFSSNRNGAFEIFVINADGTDLRQITHADPASCCGDQDPSWSADGTQISFRTQRNGSELRCRIGVNGSGATC